MKIKFFSIYGVLVALATCPWFFSSRETFGYSVIFLLVIGGYVLYLQSQYDNFTEKLAGKEFTKEDYIEYLLGWKLSNREKYILIDIAPAFLKKWEINEVANILYEKSGFHDVILRRMQDRNVELFLKNKKIREDFVRCLHVSIKQTDEIISCMKTYVILHGLNDKGITEYISGYYTRLQQTIGKQSKVNVEKMLVALVEAWKKEKKHVKHDEELIREQFIKKLNFHIEEIKKQRERAVA